MSCDFILRYAEVETVFTNEKTLDELVLFRKRREVPSFEFVRSYLDVVYSPHFGRFLVIFHLSVVHVLVLVVFPRLVFFFPLLLVVELFQLLLYL